MPNETDQTCDCPPGICLSDSHGFQIFPDFLNELFRADLGEPGEDLGVEDDELHFEEEEVDGERMMALEATAQLGRIVEGLTEVVSVHAGLLKQLVG